MGMTPARVARFTARRPIATLCVAALVTAFAAWRISKLRLETSFTELLPARDPAVVVLRELDSRMAALSSLSVVVQGPNPDENRAFTRALAPRIQALHDPLIDAVVVGVEEERAFFAKHRWLYATSEQLADAEARLRAATAKRNPLYVELDDDEPADDLASVEREFERGPDYLAKFADGAYCSQSACAVVIWLRSSLLEGGRHAEPVVARVRAEVRALLAERGARGQTAGVTGNLVTAAAERHALAADLGLVTVVTVGLVGLAVFWYFGRLRAVALMIAPTAVGTTAALAFAQLAFGQLNTATAFLGAIIVGNGINYAIVQMARYDEERAHASSIEEAAERAVAASWRGTALAAAGAALAYGTLALTDFRGFNQFGLIGGVGMIVSWLATIVVLPAAWAIADRRKYPNRTLRHSRVFGAVARAVVHRPRAILLAATALTIAAGVVLVPYARDPFEYDFNRLRNQSARYGEPERLAGTLSTIFGRALSPSFVLADRPEQAPEIARALRDGDRTLHVLGEVRTIDDFLPVEQTEKLATLARIRALIDSNLDRASEDDRARLERLRPPDDLRAIGPRDLPASVRRYYTERDGTIGRVVAYFPRSDISVWDGRVQMKLASLVRQIRLADGSSVRSSGPAVVFAGMLDAIRHDGPRLTAIAVASVAIMIAVFAGIGAVPIVASLVVGVVWMLGALALAGVRLNFLNFVALPITFGIAVDYAANVYLRYRADGRGSIVHAVETTGSAVALCSLTTIIGYGSLLAADTQALRSFGIAAVLGELACLATALLILPAGIALFERRRTA
jgi:predicted RND superfamily exporter protein